MILVDRDGRPTLRVIQGDGPIPKETEEQAWKRLEEKFLAAMKERPAPRPLTAEDFNRAWQRLVDHDREIERRRGDPRYCPHCLRRFRDVVDTDELESGCRAICDDCRRMLGLNPRRTK